jgi:serine/threonine protein kinase
LSDVDDTPAPAGQATTTVDGFFPYASPEALLDQPQDARSDNYSLAATMWTMLAGYPPFAPDSGEPPDPAEYRERVLRRFGVDAILIAAIIAVSVAIVLTVVAAGLLLR